MANWKHQIDIRETWNAAKDDENEIPNLCREIHRQLMALNISDHDIGEYIHEIADEFMTFAEDADEGCPIDIEYFDAIMENLYNVADTRLLNNGRFIWIKTF